MVIAKASPIIRKYFRRSCTCKAKLDYISAETRVRNKEKENLSLYSCRFCGCYHVGHKPKRQDIISYVNKIPRITLLDCL